jgi:hypothetical protein
MPDVNFMEDVNGNRTLSFINPYNYSRKTQRYLSDNNLVMKFTKSKVTLEADIMDPPFINLSTGLHPEIFNVSETEFENENYTVFNQITVTNSTTDSHLFNALLSINYTVHIHNNHIIINQPKRSTATRSQYMHRKTNKHWVSKTPTTSPTTWKSTPAVKRGRQAYKKHATWRSWIGRQLGTFTTKPKSD